MSFFESYFLTVIFFHIFWHHFLESLSMTAYEILEQGEVMSECPHPSRSAARSIWERAFIGWLCSARGRRTCVEQRKSTGAYIYPGMIAQIKCVGARFKERRPVVSCRLCTRFVKDKSERAFSSFLWWNWRLPVLFFTNNTRGWLAKSCAFGRS